MADLDFTSASVRDATPVNQSFKIKLIAAVAISAGQAVYQNSSGLAALADASDAATATCIGVALDTVSIGQPVGILVVGFVTGFDLSGTAYDTIIAVSNTAGDLENAGGGTVSAPVGRVYSLGDSDATKAIFLNCLYNLNVLPA